MRRRVAVKLIKAGMDTRDVVARFGSERQALALMDHPAIAKVFDAGSTPGGRPYFVMEYVSGSPITAYCDKHKLTTQQRLELFIHVCEGVQHAHQKAIIHRDLKPSNILVTQVDGKPMPRIIDFGVAKATSQRLSAETIYTHLGMVVGTVGYMSPEQADSGGEDIDTRSDVYSLGVVLYELLVGALPLDFRKLAFDEILRRLREDDPSSPSLKIRTLAGEAAIIAESRGVDPPSLIRQLRGDLDAIPLKALEKDRSRRYATPMDLAADIGRCLRDEPVLAHAPGKLYRLRKLARRNRLLVTSVAAILPTLVAATVVSTREAIYAIRAQRSAAASLKQWQEESAKAEAVNDFLQEMLESADPRSASKADPAKGRDVTVAQVLDGAARRLDAGSFRKQPLVEGAARESLGTTFMGLGRYPEAERQYRAALAVRRSAPGLPESDVASSEAYLSVLLTSEDKLPEAETLERDALRIRIKLFGRDDPLVATSLSDLSTILRREGKNEEAEAVGRQSLAGYLKANRTDDAAKEEHNLGIILRYEKRLPDAEVMFRKALATFERIDGLDHPQTARTMNQLAYVLRDERKLAEAEQYASNSLATSRRLLGDDHPDVAVGLNLLGTLQRDEGKPDEAEASFRQALAVGTRALGPDSTDVARIELLPPDHPDIFNGESTLGGVLTQEGRFRDAEPLLLSGYQGLEKAPASQAQRRAQALDRIVEMYTAWDRKAPGSGKADLAAKWKAVAAKSKEGGLGAKHEFDRVCSGQRLRPRIAKAIPEGPPGSGFGFVQPVPSVENRFQAKMPSPFPNARYKHVSSAFPSQPETTAFSASQYCPLSSPTSGNGTEKLITSSPADV